ncbi:AAA family ATPase [Psychrobacillus glaciei]|uniref:AAA family ATPase n=1 Tax=Psychrobacillus glaciei TaxID=2283160 RepID=A0A5J6SMC0_9BACI|nr:sigma 54-interacting transcriptional regulator [Psychrobacillus glaciei]QFF99056.1 AAA family ATPase [Psychrobacillus glaciei]
MNFSELYHLSDYDNVLIVDANGITIFFDLADLNILQQLGLKPEEFLRKHVTSFYQDLSIEDSTLMRVLKTGESLWNMEQKLTSTNGFSYISKSSSFPIKKGDIIIGAIEFSKHYYQKQDMQKLEKFAENKIYRKNNTIYTIDNLVSESKVMKEVKNKIQKVSNTDSNVLIYGKTGTGKEIVAQAIHNLSIRYTQPFISINCAEIDTDLMEHILFGNEKDDVTATPDIIGLLEKANGGTIFLDEVNALDIKFQAKLLKVIEDKIIRRVGSKYDIHLNIRVIATTNENPDQLVEKKMLREDLFYRLSVFRLDLPLLTERKEDVEALTNYFIQFYNRHMQMTIDDMEEDVLITFKQYNWPGNIRELKNAIETAYNNANTNVITRNDIPSKIKNYSSTLLNINKPENNINLKDKVEEYEKSLIVLELGNSGGKLAESARRLGISKQLLKYKMEKYELR